MRRRSVPPGASGPWPAPAKLNLWLHVTGRRPDGYHDLQTLFQFLGFTDWLYFEPNATGEIRCADPPAGIAAGDDLTVRAAHLLKARTGCRDGVTIYLDKRLPLGAGLGGGSSDAATTLLLLNRLWRLDMSINELAEAGLALGADVPVFVHGRAAIAEGVGERLTPVTPPEHWFLVVNPSVSISTADIFSDVELTRDTPRMTIADLLSDDGRNDCQAVVCNRYPEVAAALKWLNEYASARMTGTGSCVFAAFDSAEDAQAAADRVPDHWNGYVARGMNRSPLHIALE
ncbi:MAG: 4-(cytidine 5'-diphospho)-2-C-methyl-D-erythritol kinase [Gammaproteobacteria bacterium]